MIEIDARHWRDCTLGRLRFQGFRCFTLELPWRDNARNISCIPPGTYWIRKFISPRFGMVFLFEDVPNRSAIEIHAGNYTRDIEGCILVGKSITHLDGDQTPDVTSSRDTLAALLNAVPERTQAVIKRA